MSEDLSGQQLNQDRIIELIRSPLSHSDIPELDTQIQFFTRPGMPDQRDYQTLIGVISAFEESVLGIQSSDSLTEFERTNGYSFAAAEFFGMANHGDLLDRKIGNRLSWIWYRVMQLQMEAARKLKDATADKDQQQYARLYWHTLNMAECLQRQLLSGDQTAIPFSLMTRVRRAGAESAFRLSQVTDRNPDIQSEDQQQAEVLLRGFRLAQADIGAIEGRLHDESNYSVSELQFMMSSAVMAFRVADAMLRSAQVQEALASPRSSESNARYEPFTVVSRALEVLQLVFDKVTFMKPEDPKDQAALQKLAQGRTIVEKRLEALRSYLLLNPLLNTLAEEAGLDLVSSLNER